ncbi:cytochrome P450 6B5-like [Maniola hyperantus]|uniref:cytochrome P450 6B5-like n=1 Tax=Aphantopus hyperantus TaxID=2795564 RepID=UPI001569CA6D|nr:cytochrome P450 6B5-like [Maniola hyperantus]
MVLYYIFAFFITIIICALQYLLTKNHDHWKKRKVPHLKPSLLFGNYKETILLKKHQSLVAHEICKQFPNEPYIGTFYGTSPALIIQDPDLIKLVFVTDFYYFSGREVSDYSHKEPITNNIFFTGGDKWKILRQNSTPLYSAAKIKGMFHLIKDRATQFECLLEDATRNSPYLDVKALLAMFTIDVITSCAFGINCNSMDRNADPSTNPFMVLRDKILNLSKIAGMKLYCRQMWPSIFYGLGFTLFDKNLNNFFGTILSGVFETRESTQSSTCDFVDLILTWKQKKVLTGDSLSNIKTGGKKTISLEVTNDLLVSQCVGMFAAGFETTANTLSYFLFEIAKNQDAQTKVISEVDSYFAKNDTIEYECVNELPYIVACIEETLRLYPIMGLTTREVMDDYTLPTGLSLKKGDRIHISIYSLHHNPDYFPEPKVFRPERFYGDARKDIKPFTFFPFGEGARICIGLRFAKMPMHAALLTIFKNYRVELAEDMPLTLPFIPFSLVTTSAIPIKLKFIPRTA